MYRNYVLTDPETEEVVAIMGGDDEDPYIQEMIALFAGSGYDVKGSVLNE